MKNYKSRFGIIASLTFAFAGCALEATDEEELGTKSQEIWQGDVAAANLAVVELTRNGAAGPCTGFFISRRHIMTAAHCTDRTYGSQYYGVRIKTGYGTFVNMSDTASPAGWVLLGEATHPSWNWDAQTAATDVAILTIPLTASNSVPAAQQLLRLSTASPTLGASLAIWAWGRLVPGGAAPHDLYSGSGGSQITVSSASGGDFRAVVNNNARTCRGDSGGPATRLTSGYYIAVGPHRGNSVNTDCAATGDTMIWSDLAGKKTWIETVMQGALGGGFSCTAYGSGTTAYMKCF